VRVLAGWLWVEPHHRRLPVAATTGFAGAAPQFRRISSRAARPLHGMASGGAPLTDRRGPGIRSRRAQLTLTTPSPRRHFAKPGLGFRKGRFRSLSRPALNDRGAPGGLRDPSGRGRARRAVSADREGNFFSFGAVRAWAGGLLVWGALGIS
jgi:hypothetical protein